MECDFSVYLDGEEVSFFRDVNDSILSLFESHQIESTMGDRAQSIVAESGITRREDFYFENKDYQLTIGVQRVGEMRDKLRVLGYGKGGLRHLYDHFKIEMLESKTRSLGRYTESAHGLDGLIPEIQVEIDNLNSFDYDEWFDIVSERSTTTDSKTSTATELLHYYDDPLFVLGVTLIDEDGAKNLIFDFTDMYEDSDDINESVNAYKTNSGKPIIITEGTTDNEFLKNSIAILYPHLSRYVRFLETDFKPETNADAILKMAKNFAAAGISESMLFILDNDSAGAAAIASLGVNARRQLPASFCVTQYPIVELLNNYPTKGPQGDTRLNVNGRAGSIELYLGVDVLTDGDENLRPIQWKGFIEKVDAYQGEVLEKRRIQDSFRTKYRSVLGGEPIDSTNWIEMKALLEHIFDQLSDLPMIYPMKEY